MEKKPLFPQFPHFLHGADYNPEQWIGDKSVWDADMALMKGAHCNVMTVGIFSWSFLEPSDGVYDFSFLDEIIEKIYESGGRVILATPSAARPHWLCDKYPEVLRVTKQGERRLFGGRHNHCLTSPVYRRKVAEINTRLSARYGAHPAVLAWHISNEYGGECFCPLCRAAFRDFLRERYEGSIAKLNEAYWTSFWSHTYDSFEQVDPPMDNGEKSVHGLSLDWRRFVSHQTRDFMRAEIAAVRAGGSSLPVTINMMPGVRDTDYAAFAKDLDVISWDSYPNWHSQSHLHDAYYHAFWHDYFRALKQKPFMLMEHAPGVTNWKPYNKLKRPGMNKLAALQAVAHGSDTVQYFQFRKSRGSAEKFHGAVVDHVGNDQTRIFGEVREIGQALEAIREVLGTMPNARVAILYDFECRWALTDAQGFAREGDKGYLECCVEYYRVLWERGIATDIVDRKASLDRYDLVIAPQLYMTDDETAARLARFVERGGTLYATYMLGMVNENDLCHLGGFPGGVLRRVFGIWNEEIDTLYPEDRVQVKTRDGALFVGKEYCEILHTEGAEVLATYQSEFYAGTPAMTVNRYGKGRAYYQAFRDDGDFKDTVLGALVEELHLERALNVPLPKGVSAHARGDGEHRYVFVENYTGRPVELPLDGRYTDMESGERVERVQLSDFDVRILKQ